MHTATSRVRNFSVTPSCLSDYYGSTALASATIRCRAEQIRTGFEGSGQTKVPVFQRRTLIWVKNEANQTIDYRVDMSWVDP